VANRISPDSDAPARSGAGPRQSREPAEPFKFGDADERFENGLTTLLAGVVARYG
jgi:hypothetical protein